MIYNGLEKAATTRTKEMTKFFLRREKGTTIVEFAVIATLLFATIFGIIELGLLMYDQHVLTNASREGARAGIVMKVPRLTDNEIETIVNAYAQQHMVSFKPSATLSTTITPAEASRSGGGLFGTEMVVKVTYPYEFIMLSGLGVSPVTLNAETRMRME